jgi:hypothetical protein
METIICRKCQSEKPETEFYLNNTNGRCYRKRTCSKCDNKERKWRTTNIDRDALRRRDRLKSKRQRRDPAFIAKHIVNDSRKSDRRKNRVNDLDREWVNKFIANGCRYCGETKLRMTLDRIDNSKGHAKTNVNPACIRCNYMRRDMPYEAWLLLVDGVRAARNAGVFGSWTGFRPQL